MRVLLVLSILLLAGCTAPEEEEDQPKEIWGACPQWVHGGETWFEALNVTGSATTVLDGNRTSYQENPLDLFVVQVNVTGDLHLRFYRGDRQLQVHLDDEVFQPSLHIADGATEIRLFLSPVAHGSAADAGPLTIVADGDGTADFRIQPWFRVCGTP